MKRQWTDVKQCKVCTAVWRTIKSSASQHEREGGSQIKEDGPEAESLLPIINRFAALEPPLAGEVAIFRAQRYQLVWFQFAPTALPAVSGSAGGLGAPMAKGSTAHHTKRGSPLSNGSFSIDLDRTVIISLVLDVVKLFSKTPNFEQIKAVIKLIQGLQTPKTNSSSVNAARPFKAYFCSLMKRQSIVNCQF